MGDMSIKKNKVNLHVLTASYKVRVGIWVIIDQKFIGKVDHYIQRKVDWSVSNQSLCRGMIDEINESLRFYMKGRMY